MAAMAARDAVGAAGWALVEEWWLNGLSNEVVANYFNWPVLDGGHGAS